MLLIRSHDFASRRGGCSVPIEAQELVEPVYLFSPHLSVAEIEPTYPINTLRCGSQSPSSQFSNSLQSRQDIVFSTSRGTECKENNPLSVAFVRFHDTLINWVDDVS